MKSYSIKVRHHYCVGTFFAPTDGWLLDRELKRKQFESREAAQKAVDELDALNFRRPLNHAEYAKPTYEIEEGWLL